MLYLDSSAIVKLVVREPESSDLVDLVRRDPRAVSSALARTEVMRATRRAGVGRARATTVLDGIAFVPVDEAILHEAGSLPPRAMRSLDAIHLASALSLRPDVDAMVAYDERLAEAAELAGVDVLAPGQS